MCKWLYWLIQWTWGLPQTLAGFVLYLYYRKSPHAAFYGAVHTKWPKRDGVSLGMFIFTPEGDDGWGGEMVWHEYGHTFQSLMLGPLYLLVIGLPSAVWCGCFRSYRLRNGVSYSALGTERWADKLGDGRKRAYGVHTPREYCGRGGTRK